jgi:HSP20 family protein
MTMSVNPFQDLEGIETRLDRLFGHSPLRAAGDKPLFGNWDPALDIEETHKEYVVVIDLPAVKKQDLKVRLQGGVLTVEGERRFKKEAKSRTYHRLERQYGRFLRRFTVPSAVDAAAVKAEYRDGVLQVRLPKSSVSKPTTADVKVA